MFSRKNKKNIGKEDFGTWKDGSSVFKDKKTNKYYGVDDEGNIYENDTDDFTKTKQPTTDMRGFEGAITKKGQTDIEKREGRPEKQDDYDKTKKRWTFVEEYFKEHKINYVIIESLDGSILTKLICLIYLLDYASIYAAIYSKTDPTPVKPIEYFKNIQI